VPRVLVFTHNDVEVLKKSARGSRIHRAEEIEVYALAPAFIDALAALTERSNRWTLARNDAEIYVTVKGETITTRLERHSLDGDGSQ
jgi:uncharacterized protein YaeQ